MKKMLNRQDLNPRSMAFKFTFDISYKSVHIFFLNNKADSCFWNDLHWSCSESGFPKLYPKPIIYRRYNIKVILHPYNTFPKNKYTWGWGHIYSMGTVYKCMIWSTRCPSTWIVLNCFFTKMISRSHLIY